MWRRKGNREEQPQNEELAMFSIFLNGGKKPENFKTEENFSQEVSILKKDLFSIKYILFPPSPQMLNNPNFHSLGQ